MSDDGGIKVEAWKEYDISSVEMLDAAVKESGDRPFRIYGQDRTYYFNLSYNTEDNSIFAYEMILFDPLKKHDLGQLIVILMRYMNDNNITAKHAPVCSSAGIGFYQFKDKMYELFPNVKRVQ